MRCGDKSFADRHDDQVLIDVPFDWDDITFRVFAPAECDSGLPGL